MHKIFLFSNWGSYDPPLAIDTPMMNQTHNRLLLPNTPFFFHVLCRVLFNDFFLFLFVTFFVSGIVCQTEDWVLVFERMLNTSLTDWLTDCWSFIAFKPAGDCGRWSCRLETVAKECELVYLVWQPEAGLIQWITKYKKLGLMY